MDRTTPPPEPPRLGVDGTEAPIVDQMIRAYVGFLAGMFDIGQLAAGRRLQRSGAREPLLHD